MRQPLQRAVNFRRRHQLRVFHDALRLCETPSGMLNAVGLQNIGVRSFVEDKLPLLRGCRAAVIANVFGCSVQEYVEVIRILEDAEGLAGYELNVSCPNTSHGGIQ